MTQLLEDISLIALCGGVLLGTGCQARWWVGVGISVGGGNSTCLRCLLLPEQGERVGEEGDLISGREGGGRCGNILCGV